MTTQVPPAIEDEAMLDDMLSQPSDALVETLARLEGDITILGVGGKMGPTLARMAKRAAPDKRVIGVARFSDAALRDRLEGWGIETVACDLLDRSAVEGLEKTANAVFMAGRKFGSEGNQPLTWAMNSHVPAIVAEAFRDSRIAVFSTACVYAFADVHGPGAREGDPLTPPGEYANSCIGRERMFEHFSNVHGTRLALIRLSYAIDLRYGVLHDIARAVLDGEPVPLASGHCNVIWQRDANDIALRTLAHADHPAFVLNLSGPELASVRQIALRFGDLFGKDVTFEGAEQDEAWIVDTGRQQRLFGYPTVPLPVLVDWTADWLKRGGKTLGKPTRFEVRDGTY
ncbi:MULTISPECIES: NAD(P)-dependent oxidoreductase [unclassified Roseitalea]|uniref:NAD-dependent epimerase/dehydratase family protein n=1 Tax=unclassified Roseitalea TaxID=2639107 RepID=UPI00273D2C2F|nr:MULTISPECIES: NAD(P)-dependent oxidoreductase [unclassified Roseitalea]